MEISAELRERFNKFFTIGSNKVEKLSSELSDAKKDKKIAEDLKDFISKDQPIHIYHYIKKESNRLRKLRESNDTIIPYLEELYQIVKNETANILKPSRFPNLLEQACKESGLKIDMTSRHPKYSFYEGFFQLDIDEKKGMAKISDFEGQLKRHSADISAIIDTLKEEYSRVFKRSFNGGSMLKLIRKHYKNIIKESKESDGTAVPVRKIMDKILKEKKNYRRDMFLYDFSKLVSEGPYEIDKRMIDLQQTKDTSQGLLLYKSEARGYIGFLIFKESK